MSQIRSFEEPLKKFLSSNASFEIVYNTSNGFANHNVKRFCILDSSFNPPHLGHYALVEESLIHDYGTDDKLTERSVLLLLSVKNADKGYQPESFEKRLEMMYLMADHLHKEFNVDVSIGLSKHAKFVDKSVSILDYLDKSLNHPSNIKMTFMVGFDTLIRVLNPKYYMPDKLSTSLEGFMKVTDLLCMTRVDTTTIDENQINQSTYITDISTGKHENIPSHWSKKLFLVDTKGDKINYISSSGIRSSIEKNDDKWHELVLPEIKEFAIKEGLYKNN